MSVNVSTSNNPTSVSVQGGSASIVVSGGIGPKGADGAAGVSSVNSLTGAITLAVVGGTITYAGNTITLTVTGGGGASSWSDLNGKPFSTVGAGLSVDGAGVLSAGVQSVAGRTGTVVLDVADVSGAVATSDARLSDSREWSAATVTRADAEAGVATVRAAWTVQRVWQAIAAAVPTYSRRSDAVGGVSYLGRALVGTATSSPAWTIKKTTVSSNGSIASSLTAAGVAWDDRLTASYS